MVSPKRPFHPLKYRNQLMQCNVQRVGVPKLAAAVSNAGGLGKSTLSNIFSSLLYAMLETLLMLLEPS
jgi:hypothetical protein